MCKPLTAESYQIFDNVKLKAGISTVLDAQTHVHIVIFAGYPGYHF